MASVNDKFKGLGAELYHSTPEDIADANKALANSFGQIKNVFNVTPQQLATVGSTLETLKGLDKLDGKKIPEADTVEYFKNEFAGGSGKNGEYLLTDVVGTPAGWVHKDELTAEGPRLKELDDIGALDKLTKRNGSIASSTGHGVYTIMKFHVVDNAYQFIQSYDFSTTPPTPIYAWSLPAGLGSTAGTFGSRSAALQHLIDAANTRINEIAAAYPLQAAQSIAAMTNISNQLKREKSNWQKAGIVPANTQSNTDSPIFNFVGNIHDYGQDTRLGGKAWIFEQMANQNSRGGQAIIGAMREGRNIKRLSDVGIPTSLFRENVNTAEEQATLLNSTYTVEEAKNSIKE